MSLLVQKFGGTSVATAERIESVADKISGFHKRGVNIVVVVSAMSGETNRLIKLANRIDETASSREMDALLSTGEQVTVALLCIGSQVPILTDNAYSKARILDIEPSRIQKDLAKGQVIVVAGFQGVDEQGNITTLGRGGSDTTAVALAVALKAEECQIYTDVDGVYTTDPRVVENARRLDSITFEEMLEMASQGSKVLQIRAVEFAGKYKIPLRVLSTFNEGSGTLITLEDNLNM
jgi:aspartate kinase